MATWGSGPVQYSWETHVSTNKQINSKTIQIYSICDT